MTKAFAYLRVSGKGRIKGDGFARQLQAIRGYAAAHEIKTADVFREEGVGSITNDAIDGDSVERAVSLINSFVAASTAAKASTKVVVSGAIAWALNSST